MNKISPLGIVTDVIVFSRETGSIACHGAPGVSNTAGASLWVSDYALQAASLGIEETFFHEGIGSRNLERLFLDTVLQAHRGQRRFASRL